MTQARDLHVHTVFSDGKNTPEEMILAAIEKGFSTIGISDHSYTLFDEAWCIKKQNIPDYIVCINALKTKYNGKIDVLCGIEQDYWGNEATTEYDYVIGSVHYLKFGSEYVPVDDGSKNLVYAADKYLDGDIYAVTEVYYSTLANVVAKTGADIIAHFDLIAKYNEQDPVFDEQHPRYVAAWQGAADKLLKTGKLFEINTGAIYRGCRSIPYPSHAIYAYLKERGAKFILADDSHTAEAVGFRFEQYQDLL